MCSVFRCGKEKEGKKEEREEREGRKVKEKEEKGMRQLVNTTRICGYAKDACDTTLM